MTELPRGGDGAAAGARPPQNWSGLAGGGCGEMKGGLRVTMGEEGGGWGRGWEWGVELRRDRGEGGGRRGERKGQVRVS